MRPGARVLLGITGGIAAYKSVLLIRELQQRGAQVRAIATPAALRFIGIETLRAITREQVPSEVFPREGADVSGGWTLHIHWAEWADLMVVAPCTANTLAKLATGLSDNLLTSAALALRSPLLVCPTMDGEMYRHRTVRRNLDTLQADGVHILAPEHGYLASGQSGQGRLPETSVIVERIASILAGSTAAVGTIPDSDPQLPPSAPHEGPLRGTRVLVTAGPTREPIDAVRHLSNPSTGKMGIAMARAAQRMGAEVHLLLGPTGQDAPDGIPTTRFTTAQELFDLVRGQSAEAGLVIMCAAVSDFRPVAPSTRKIPKGEAARTLTLEPTDDILAWLGRNRRPGQRLVGFAMETHQALDNARDKLRRKGVDALLMNELREGRSGFATDRNELTLLRPDVPDRTYGGTKAQVAMKAMEDLLRGWDADSTAP